MVAGAFHINPANWHPVHPRRLPTPIGHSHFGYSGILSGASSIFFAYIGFDAVSTAAEETTSRSATADRHHRLAGDLHHPVHRGVRHPHGRGALRPIDINAPIADALKQIGIGWAEALISIGALAGITTVMLVLYFGLTRGCSPCPATACCPSPWRGSIRSPRPRSGDPGSGVVIALIAGLSPIGKVAQLVNLGTLAAFFMVCASVIVLRKTRPS